MSSAIRAFSAVLVVALGFALAGATIGASIWASQGLAAEKLSPATMALFDAVRTNDLPAVKRSLLEGADIRAENTGRLNPIDLAVDKGYFPIAHYLLAWRKQRTSPIQPVLPAPPREEASVPPEPTIPSLRVDPEPQAPAPAAALTVPVYTLPEISLPSAPPAPAAPEPAPPSPVSGPTPGPKPWAGGPQQVIPEPELPPGEAEPPLLPVIDQTGPQQAYEAEQETGTGLLDTVTGLFGFGRDKDTAIKPAPAPLKPQPATPAEESKDSGGVFNTIAEFFSSEPEPAAKPLPPQQAPTPPAPSPAPEPKPEPEKAEIPKAPAPAPPPIPEPEPEPEKAEITKAPAPSPPPEPEPEKAETPDPPAPPKPIEPEDRGTILGRISDLLSPSPETEPPPSSRDKAVAALPETASELAPKPPPLPPSPPETTEPEKAAGIRRLATEPYLGSGLKLGNPRIEKSGETCVRKKTQGTWYCIEAVDWGDEIGDAFQVHTTLYRGRKAIVRYVDGKAVQFHALFRKGNFQAIVRFLTKRFGPPSERLGMPVAMLGEPNRVNKIVRWAGPADPGAGESTLEVRQVDDLRWSAPPDARHGVVRLYLKGADPVFKHVSWSDFLLARVRKRRE